MGRLSGRAKGLMGGVFRTYAGIARHGAIDGVDNLPSSRGHNRAAKKSKREPVRRARLHLRTIRCAGGRSCITGSPERDASRFLPPMQCKAEHSSCSDRVRMLSMQTRRRRPRRYVAAAGPSQAALILGRTPTFPLPRIGTGRRSARFGVGSGKAPNDQPCRRAIAGRASRVRLQQLMPSAYTLRGLVSLQMKWAQVQTSSTSVARQCHFQVAQDAIPTA
jgi:hypothetical protein